MGNMFDASIELESLPHTLVSVYTSTYVRGRWYIIPRFVLLFLLQVPGHCVINNDHEQCKGCHMVGLKHTKSVRTDMSTICFVFLWTQGDPGLIGRQSLSFNYLIFFLSLSL